jgi:CRISPR-associated endonuclease Cas2
MNKYLIVYYISDKKRKEEIVSILQGYGVKVNKNVFELIIKERDFQEILDIIYKIVDKKKDSFRVYFIDEISFKKSFTLTKENAPFISNSMIV